MSTVRMCDYTMPDGKVCGTIFSERDDGWSTGTVTMMKDDEDSGIRRAIVEQIDLCPDHSPTPQKRQRREYPRLGAHNE